MSTLDDFKADLYRAVAKRVDDDTWCEEAFRHLSSLLGVTAVDNFDRFTIGLYRIPNRTIWATKFDNDNWAVSVRYDPKENSVSSGMTLEEVNTWLKRYARSIRDLRKVIS